MKDTALYVYCLIDGAGDGTGVPALPGVEPDTWTYVLPLGRVAAVVSEVPLSDYGPEALEANVERIEWIGPRAQAHAQVIQALFDSRTVLPLKFGTLFYSEERAREAFSPQVDSLHAALTRLAGKEEWGIKYYGNPEALAETLAETELRSRAAASSPGQLYLLRKKMISSFQTKALGMLEDQVRKLHERLAATAFASRAGKGAGEGKLRTGEHLVFTGLYLVDRRERDAFLDRVARLESDPTGTSVRMVASGPWPPFSFCDAFIGGSPEQPARHPE